MSFRRQRKSIRKFYRKKFRISVFFKNFENAPYYIFPTLYIDFEDPTYTDYGLRIHRDMALTSYIIYRGTATFNIIANESATIHIKTSNTDRITISDTLSIIYTNFSVFGSTTLTGAATLNNNLSVAGTTKLTGQQQ